MTEKKSFGEKLLSFREAISKMDWSPDGNNVKQDYSYLSNTKMKANINQALVKAGLEWKIDFSDLQIMPPIGERMGQHYIVKAVAIISDPTDSSKFAEYTAYGEGADTGDKAISKAQTNAYKNMIANNFMVAELSVEGENVIETMNVAAEEGKSHYQASKDAARETVLARHPSKQDSDPIPPKNSGGAPTMVQKTVMEKILNKIRALDEVTLSAYGTVDEIEARYRNITGADDATEFIAQYKGVMSLQ